MYLSSVPLCLKMISLTIEKYWLSRLTISSGVLVSESVVKLRTSANSAVTFCRTPPSLTSSGRAQDLIDDLARQEAFETGTGLRLFLESFVIDDGVDRYAHVDRDGVEEVEVVGVEAFDRHRSGRRK